MAYTFQKRGIHSLWPWRKSREEAFSGNLAEFCNNLQIKFAKGKERTFVPDEFRQDTDTWDQILNFVEAVHGNAHWYNEAVVREYRAHWLFFGASLALLIGIPIGVAWGVPKLVESAAGNAGTPEVVTSQIVAVLTGFIAIQRAFGAWFANRQSLGRRWRTRSSLMKVIYDTEASHRTITGSEKREAKRSMRPLARDLKRGIEKARTIVEEETQEFFDTFQLPSIDIGPSIVSAESIAHSIYSKFRAPVDAMLRANREQKERAIRLERRHRQYENEIDLFQRRFDRISQRVSDLGGEEDHNMDAQEREHFLRLVGEIEDLEAEIRKAYERKLCIELEQQVLSVRS